VRGNRAILFRMAKEYERAEKEYEAIRTTLEGLRKKYPEVRS